MMRAVFFFLLMLTFLPAISQAKDLEIELSRDRVDITTGFDGTNVILFGTSAVEGADLIITLTGPERTMMVRRKDRLLGAWMNRDAVEFRRVPSYYDLASTMPMSADDPLFKRNEIGVDNLDFYAEDEEDPQMAEVFRDALIRRMQEKGLYPIRAIMPAFINPGFFKTTFELPPGVPTGIYTVQAILIKNDTIVAREAKTLQVGQVGFNARVYSFADKHAFFYALLAVLIASLSGWSAFTFLRRD